ncbi:MAG: tRNA uridine-5-carboxymethylaminomethyl(34) synthesis GTPase MnmE [Betaproteobacteria bacterium RIFCSPLOWO2_12_FULL_62_13]|nr:MAG: tRNA uridine-5-carboxymethylaminomethyl(34) synthesis GTPase MnmE [Betaproteobacteria bacterium RIFCSPLOWO2_12_FULL_62_13]
MAKNEIIAAVATPPGRGGIGVVRISGPSLETMLRALVNVEVAPRRATRAAFRAADGSVIDQGLVLFFPAPHSYTGEDVIELQGHGGPVVLQLLLRRCLELGARVAEPGEFTKRAFLNDKLDLAQAESVADLIDASTAEAARCAMRSLQGEFSQRVDAMVRVLTELRMLVEATLDFPDEEIEFLEHAKARDKLADLRRQLSGVLAASRQGSLLREGIHVVIAGEPNVGKSSLMNCLAGEELAIVTDIPGTTRDAIRQTINVRGVPLHMVDTAGLREPEDKVEKIGISRTWDEISKSNLVLWVSDATVPETRIADPVVAARLPKGVPQIVVINKVDLCGRNPARYAGNKTTEVALSAKTGAGIELLRDAILDAIGWGGSGEGLFMARERHLQALQTAQTHVDQASASIPQLELLAEELRLAQRALAGITGEFTADDLLGEIFSRFCIGK